LDTATAEIVACTGRNPDDVRERLWQAAVGYRNPDPDGGIVDAFVDALRPLRVRSVGAVLRRIRRYAEQRSSLLAGLRVLTFGDAAGTATLALVQNGVRCDAFDVPGRSPQGFAQARYEAAGVLDGAVRIITDQGLITRGHYDIVIAFDLLEIPTRPQRAIRGLARALKPGGLLFLTETLDVLAPPAARMGANARYRGTTAYLAFREGLALTWYDRDEFRGLMEFENRGGTLFERLRFLSVNLATLDAAAMLAWRGCWSDLRLETPP
jgi:SAM-dependent methyltransferase